MLNFMNKQILDQLNPEVGGGGGKAEAPPPPETPKDDGYDDLGYQKEAAPEGKEVKKAAPEEKEPVKESKETPIVPVTGYGDKPPEEPKQEAEPPAAPPAKDPPDEYDKMLEGISEKEAKELKSFITKHQISKEAAQGLIDLKKAEISQAQAHYTKAQKDAEDAVLKTRAAWHKELKEDREFGGEKFAKSIADAEKVLEEFMPLTKKKLTETKGMLPPYVMRDLAKLADHLYSTEKLVTGDPKEPVENDDKDDDPLAFYQ